MGFHMLDIVIIVVIGFVILGSKTLQSISRRAGRGVGKAQEVKEQLLTELPIEECAKVGAALSQISTSPQQVIQRLVLSAFKADATKNDVLPDDKKGPSKNATEIVRYARTISLSEAR